MSSSEFSFLGRARFRRDGSYLSLNSAKAVALLGYLAAEGKSLQRDHLMAIFWPDSLPQAARKNLRNTLWSVRKALGEDVIIADPEWVALGPSTWVDIHVFQDPSLLTPPPDLAEIEAAASLFQGPLLEGLSISDAPEFEIWLTAERQRLGGHYLRLLELLIAGYRSRANWPKVISVAQQALSWDSLQEPMHRALLEAYGHLGERSKAIRQYENLADLLARELGVEPLDETKIIYEAVLSGDLQPGSAGRPEVQGRPPRPRRQRPSSASPFVGRAAELEALNDEWRRVKQEQLRIVYLAGEMGIGKSRLWEEWRNLQPAEVTILETYCLNTNQAHPFAPLIRLLRTDPCAGNLLGGASPLAPIWLAELSRLLPEIRASNPDLPEPMALQPAEERLRLQEALSQLIQCFGQEPFVFFVDDLHWVDLATLDWLAYMDDRLRDVPLLLILAFRPDELPSQAARVLAGWHRQQIARRIALPLLTLPETAELLAKLGGDTTAAPDLQTRSAGNPYFLVELSRVGPDAIPPSLADLIHARLTTLPDRTRPLLQAASILELEGDFELAVLRRTAGYGEEQALECLDLLLGAGVFVEHGDKYSFSHPLVAVLVHDELSVARRRYLHSRAAAALEKVHERRLAPVAARLADHYAGSNHPAKAAFYADMAAGWAMGMAASEDAAALYRQAYLWEPTLERMTSLGQALAAAGDMPQARKVFREALASYEEEGNQAGITRAQLALAGSYMLSGGRKQVAYWADRVLSEAAGVLEPELEAQAHLMLAMGGAGAISRLSEAEAHLVRTGELAEASGLVQMALQSQFERANILAQRGDLEGAVALFALTAEQARENANPVQEMLAFNNLAYHEHLLGDLPAAKRHIEMALAMSEIYSLAPFDQFLFSTRGEIALAGGDFNEAERWFERAMAAAVVAANEVHQANLKANMGMLAQAQGDLDTALLLLQEARAALPPEGEAFLKTKIDLWIVELHLARGERAAATEILARVKESLAQSEYEGYKRQAEAIAL